MDSAVFKKDLTVLTSLIAGRKSADEIKKAYIEISKKYHPDMNGKSEEEKAFCTECMRIINQVYERYEKGIFRNRLSGIVGKNLSDIRHIQGKLRFLLNIMTSCLIMERTVIMQQNPFMIMMIK